MYDSNFKLIDNNPKVKSINRCGPETSHEHRHHHRMQLVYTRQMRERRVYMEELKEIRDYKEKQVMKTIIQSIGPKWYQALSCSQRMALDNLEFSIYQDLLEDRPRQTMKVMKDFGIYPKPSLSDLMHCVSKGRNDPKEMLARLFVINYGYEFDNKKYSYCFNARLILTGIFYLGLDNLIKLLKERFSPDETPPKSNSKIKRKLSPPLESPYLEKMVAALYEGHVRKPYSPPPLPNLDEMNNEPYEEDPPAPKPPPPPPPPPPPKKRIPISYCDKLAGLPERIHPHIEVKPTNTENKKKHSLTRSNSRRLRTLRNTETKKKYGMAGLTCKKIKRQKRPSVPSTGMLNAQYTIKGVNIVRGRAVYVLDSVSILPPDGDMIHGGYAVVHGTYVPIHCGFRGHTPPPPAESCDCLKRWQKAAIAYADNTKCYCNHFYDFGNEGSFPPDELPFFEKPTRTAPYAFNHNTIFDLDEKSLHINKEFKRIWETDSMLQEDSVIDEGKEKKKKKRRASTTCLSANPKPQDYLLCALRLMKRQNIAARLPDIHKAPELNEWMRYRLFGPLTPEQRSDTLVKSNKYWTFFKALDSRSFGHVGPPFDPQFNNVTTWRYKQKLNDRFRKYVDNYRLRLFRSYAYVNNLMWPSMCQDKFPDKKFREIFFSYMYGRVEDLSLIHPYNKKETTDRALIISKHRYCCPPAGIENIEK